MPETCDYCLGIINSCIYYAHQTSKIKLWNILSKTVHVVLVGMKDL